MDNEIKYNNRGLAYTILCEAGRDRHGAKQYKVQFISTGYTTITNKRCMTTGIIKDLLSPSIFGVGVSFVGASLYKQEYQLWYNMLSRCYNPSNQDYATYGGRNVTVCAEWLTFSNFLNDISKIDGYNAKLFKSGKLVLDKDIRVGVATSNKVYSLSKCTFVTRSTNSKNRNTETYKKLLMGIDPDGVEHEINGVVAFALTNNLDTKCIYRCLSGVQTKHKGWSFKLRVRESVTTIPRGSS